MGGVERAEIIATNHGNEINTGQDLYDVVLIDSAGMVRGVEARRILKLPVEYGLKEFPRQSFEIVVATLRPAGVIDCNVT